VQLAARIAVSNLHKNTMKSFSETYVLLFFSHIGGIFDDPQGCDLVVLIYGCSVKVMYTHINERSGLMSPLIADDVYEIIMKVRSNG
jgi:ribonucleoside-diphosphate reductase subunit M1